MLAKIIEPVGLETASLPRICDVNTITERRLLSRESFLKMKHIIRGQNKA